jgi:hypothetical protein
LDTERDLAVLIEYGVESDSLEELASSAAAESAADADESSAQLGGDLDHVVGVVQPGQEFDCCGDVLSGVSRGGIGALPGSGCLP